MQTYSTRQPNPPTTNLFSFNDIKEEVKETESQIDQNGNQPTFNIGNDLIHSPTAFKHQLHKETPQSGRRKGQNDETENSVLLQMQEYKKDINNLKK